MLFNFIKILDGILYILMGQDTSVGIATLYGL